MISPNPAIVVNDELEQFIDNEYGNSAEHEPASAEFSAVLEEISEWKLEAKLEDNARYFFHVGEVQRIEQGKRSFVIGRKGCGKTAISEHLCRLNQHDTFSVKLTFKNFPFNELYDLRDVGYAGPHQYITLWKFLIYSHVCQLMAQNENIESSIKDKLQRAYIENQAPTLPRRINKWLDRDFGFEIFGNGVNIGAPPSSDDRRQSLVSRVEKLEDVILASIDSSKYLIVFDELDEDYRNIVDKDQYEQYTSLITGLFKAVQDVRAVFATKSFRLYPIVFLRDDIYELIQDSDKTKWNDLRIGLEWNAERIKDLLAFRISRAINPSGPILSFDVAWNKIFFPSNFKLGNGGRKTAQAFEYIARSTQYRPRDFIQYLKDCCEEQLMHQNDGSRIGPRVIKKVDNAFSNYLKSELIDEIHGVLPDISTIFDVISQLRKWSFSIKEFIDAYNRQRKRTELKERDPTFVLQILFLFSVVGNHPKASKQMFRYTNKEARFNFDEQVIVHRGLFKALQIGVN
jgi:energy-coupling factor transporter ATP-binding protein EcfA2